MNIPIFDVALPIQKILYSRNFKDANIDSTLDLKHLQKKAKLDAAPLYVYVGAEAISRLNGRRLYLVKFGVHPNLPPLIPHSALNQSASKY